VTETSKVVDVLLLLGGKQHSYARGHMLCLDHTLCLMQLSVVRNLILMGCSDDIPVSGLLVIDAVGWRSMYHVVMPRVNLIVILSSYARCLYSINCPTVICLPSMYYFVYGETPLVNCGPRLTRVNSTNVLDEGLRIGEIGRRMNSKVKLVEIGICRK
jgi:hypothetical protein